VDSLRASNPELGGGADALFSAACRYIIDFQLKEQFCTAVVSDMYASILEVLPDVFVGPPFCLTPLVNLMCGELETAFLEVGRPLPPWRSAAAMIGRWMGDAYVDVPVPLPVAGPGEVRRFMNAVGADSPPTEKTAPSFEATSPRDFHHRQGYLRSVAECGCSADSHRAARPTGRKRAPAVPFAKVPRCCAVNQGFDRHSGSGKSHCVIAASQPLRSQRGFLPGSTSTAVPSGTSLLQPLPTWAIAPAKSANFLGTPLSADSVAAAMNAAMLIVPNSQRPFCAVASRGTVDAGDMDDAMSCSSHSSIIFGSSPVDSERSDLCSSPRAPETVSDAASDGHYSPSTDSFLASGSLSAGRRRSLLTEKLKACGPQHHVVVNAGSCGGLRVWCMDAVADGSKAAP